MIDPSNADGVGASSSKLATEQELPLDEASYHAQRAALIDAERRQRFDAPKRGRRTPAEKQADAVVRTLKAQEDQTLWNASADDRADSDANARAVAFKGASWPIAKQCGATHGVLFDLVRRMPKGAVLHCHLDGTVDPAWLIRRATSKGSLHMRASAPLTRHRDLYASDIDVVFRQLPEEVGTPADGGFAREAGTASGSEIWSDAYRPNTWVPVRTARASFPFDNVYKPAPAGFGSDVAALMGDGAAAPCSESAAAFDAYLHSLLTLTPVPGHLTPPLTNSRLAWARFTRTFGVVEGLMTHDIRGDYMVESFRTAIRDNISYVEARVPFYEDRLLGPDMQDSLTHVGMVELVEQSLSIVQSELPVGQSFDCKIIYSTLRFISCAQLRGYVEDALALKQQFPDRIVGFDLVGHEDEGVTLREYIPELLRLRTRAAELKIDLPLCLHAGETLGDGNAIDDNLYDAVLLGTRRIGHGFCLARHPLLLDLVRTRGICIESCPISSQMLRYTDSTAAHPVLALLGHGCPVALSHDDPCQFLNAGLSPDFYQLLSASDHIDLTSLGVLARSSLVHSLIPDNDQKQQRVAEWDQQWAAFVDTVAAMQV